ncbi:hypothetical protein BJX76DRAFT_351328 [Aspergillus varians]
MAGSLLPALQEALQCLTPTSRDNLPTDQASLRTYLIDLRTKARLIIDSVPEPPPPPKNAQNTTTTTTNITPSPARLDPKDETTTAHQQAWSKPIVKPSPSKDNPYGIPIYKLPGADGKGHWFGRRSVHQGLPYAVWEERLSGEIAETLRRNQERVAEGFPPDQAVRGIGAERVVEEVIIRDDRSDGKGGKAEGEGGVLGRLNIYHVSATFPRPTTSRDFVVMIVTWEDEGWKGDGKGEREGRSWMMVSRPCEHPDAPPVGEYIRGQYESVEMVREILVDKDGSDASGSGSGSGSGSNHTNGERGEESNHVEWTMVTRSDPGGTIPRWLVEKGTPRSICTDAAKFIDWASHDPEVGKEHKRLQSAAKPKSSRATNTDESEDSSDSELSEYYEPEEHHGLIASFGNLLNAGLERYAPQTVLDYIPQHSRQSSYNNMPDDESEEVPEYTPEHHEHQEHQEHQEHHQTKEDETQSQVSLHSEMPTEPNIPGDINLDITTTEMLQRTQKGKLSSHERQLAKLAQEKRSVETQIELVRSDIQSLGLRLPEDKDKDKDEAKKEKSSTHSSVDNPNHSSTDQPAVGSPNSSTKRLGLDDRTSSSSNLRSRAGTPTTDKPEMQKAASALFREEAKLVRRLSKIERNQVKEAAKIEVRHRKNAEKQDKARSRDETATLRKEVDDLKKECDKLKSERAQWLGLVNSLQAENTRLARQLGGEAEK